MGSGIFLVVFSIFFFPFCSFLEIKNSTAAVSRLFGFALCSFFFFFCKACFADLAYQACQPAPSPPLSSPALFTQGAG